MVAIWEVYVDISVDPQARSPFVSIRRLGGFEQCATIDQYVDGNFREAVAINGDDSPNTGSFGVPVAQSQLRVRAAWKDRQNGDGKWHGSALLCTYSGSTNTAVDPQGNFNYMVVIGTQDDTDRPDFDPDSVSYNAAAVYILINATIAPVITYASTPKPPPQ